MTPNEQKVSTAKGMVPVTDALLDQMVQAIVAEVDPEQVILEVGIVGHRGTVHLSGREEIEHP